MVISQQSLLLNAVVNLNPLVYLSVYIVYLSICQTINSNTIDWQAWHFVHYQREVFLKLDSILGLTYHALLTPASDKDQTGY